VASIVPPGLNATAFTGPVCPASAAVSCNSPGRRA
jgi:hypothetical protein